MSQNKDWERIEAGRLRKLDQAAASTWRHPADPEPEPVARRQGAEAGLARGLVESVILPVIWRKRRGVRVGFAAFVILVRHADATYFGKLTDVELAKGLGMSIRDFRAESRELLPLGGQAREGLVLLRAILECVLPPAIRCGGIRRWKPAFDSLVCMLYVVSPESFNGMTKEELVRVLGAGRSRLMQRFARVEKWLAQRQAPGACKKALPSLKN